VEQLVQFVVVMEQVAQFALQATAMLEILTYPTGT
jgi:hypothetical protein